MSERTEDWGYNTFTFTLQCDCPHCGTMIPLNGPLRSTVCANCQKRVSFTPTVWADQIAAAAQGSRIINCAYTARPTQSRDPCCPRCERHFPYDMSLVGHDTQMTCPHCGAAVSTYPAPEWLTEMLPYVMQLAAADREDGEPADATAAVAEQEAHKPVMLTCPNCSGALSVTAESQRVLPCGYCGAEVFLPDAIWQRLHPAQTVRPWTLFYAYQGPDILWTADKIAEREARLEEGRRRYREQLAREAEQKRIKKKNLVGSLLFLGVSIAVPIIILVLPRC